MLLFVPAELAYASNGIKKKGQIFWLEETVDTVQFLVGRARSHVGPAVEIIINGRDLLELVKAVELPFAQQEGHPNLAGDYEGLPPSVVFLPSRHLLDKPNPIYSREEKREIYRCPSCGLEGCWPLAVAIQLAGDKVTWKDFEQPHRTFPYPKQPAWNYDRLGPFVFDRANYEKALQRH